ncbi:MAG: hypothetical protein ACOY3Y_20675 [Acidobacteriota bacterium]
MVQLSNPPLPGSIRQSARRTGSATGSPPPLGVAVTFGSAAPRWMKPVPVRVKVPPFVEQSRSGAIVSTAGRGTASSAWLQVAELPFRFVARTL